MICAQELPVPEYCAWAFDNPHKLFSGFAVKADRNASCAGAAFCAAACSQQPAGQASGRFGPIAKSMVVAAGRQTDRIARFSGEHSSPPWRTLRSGFAQWLQRAPGQHRGLADLGGNFTHAVG